MSFTKFGDGEGPAVDFKDRLFFFGRVESMIAVVDVDDPPDDFKGGCLFFGL